MRISDWSSDVCSSDLPTDPAAAIIAAAEAWVDHFTGEGWADPERWMVQPAQDLVAAIRAYRQSRQPQGVKPSGSMVGSRFRFCDGDEVCQLGWGYLGDRPMCIWMSDMAVSDNAAGALI